MITGRLYCAATSITTAIPLSTPPPNSEGVRRIRVLCKKREIRCQFFPRSTTPRGFVSCLFWYRFGTRRHRPFLALRYISVSLEETLLWDRQIVALTPLYTWLSRLLFRKFRRGGPRHNIFATPTWRRRALECDIQVQHRGLRETSRGDVDAVCLVVKVVDELFPKFSYKFLADEVERNLPNELNFLHEAENSRK